MGSGGVQADALARAMKEVGLAERLALASRAINGRLVFTTSFGLEDQAITHAIFRAGLDIHIELVTLDTGRLFPETYDLWAQTEERYGRRINAVSPDCSDLEALVARQGVNGFRHSVEARKACCDIRKVEPLGRALAGAAGWVTGLRAEQSAFRAAVPLALQDEGYRLIKLNPLADWSRQDLVRYVTDNAVPYNPLHDQGYPSIGCAPCTRAVRLGEPERAGRWWWEQEAKKECGLHLVPTQRIQEHSHDRRA
ncbi:phosphoadenylyl-sulfate reductase [Microvirga terrae]|uniref:Adenosine 5'-phosphosulfate reductase n=1 Tax=Microvirga terrae TaxID=2740529 RepID=A0ABY5S0A0_9HYPH|nr:phosphoadenylyl-sulfate reductase [Microvirga terrae]UVF21897.1 phosphoadenylyl-sulfate reductase [Microvirga terrae]